MRDTDNAKEMIILVRKLEGVELKSIQNIMLLLVQNKKQTN